MENVEQEFLSVIREYERVIYKVCYLYTTPNATLNDLYQEVVLNIWKAFPKFRRECKISTWIYRIALNTCISFIRKEKNIPEIVTLTQEADCSEEDDETQAMLQQLYRMINRLGHAHASEPQRTGPSNCLAKTQVYAKPKALVMARWCRSP